MTGLRLLFILSLLLGVPVVAPGGVVKLWSRTDTGPDPLGGGAGATVAMDAAGNVIVACNNRDTALSQFTVMKFAAATGTQLWKRILSGEGAAAAVAVDAAGDVYATGWGAASQRVTVYVTVKLAAATGVPVWEQRYNSPATDPFGGSDQQYATHLVLDPQGAVVVTGMAYGGGDNMTNIHTLKYSAANGAVVWSRTFAGPGDDRDVPAGLALDGSGNVLILGETGPILGQVSPLLAKYAAADGGILWQKILTPPAGFEELWPGRLASDADGNAFVTATAVEHVNQRYSWAAKYAAGSGNLVWDLPPWNLGGAGLFSEIAVTPSGGVFLGDYALRKYAPSGGSAVWEAPYVEAGPPFSSSYSASVKSVVVTPGGAVFSAGNVLHFADSRAEDLILMQHHPQTGVTMWHQTYDGSFTADSVPDPRAFAVSGENRFALVVPVRRGGDVQFDTVCFGILSPLEEWRLARLGTIANTADAADTADPDKDGIPNLVEWACLLDPMVRNPAPLTAALDTTGGLTATYTLSRAALTAGARCEVEWSSSLGPDAVWSTQNITTVITGEDAAQRILRASLTTADAARKFVRLRASAP